jgi:PKD repeat protein
MILSLAAPLSALAAPQVIYNVQVDDNFTPSTPGWGQDHFATITDGMAAVMDSGTVVVFAGTYVEDVTLSRAITLTVNDTITIDGDLTIQAGTFTAPTVTLNLTGNFNHTGGTFNPNGGTFNLNGTGQTVSGSSTFYNFVKHVTLADTLTFEAGATQTFYGLFDLSGGGSTEKLSLRSSTPGTQWKADPNAGRAVQYVDVMDALNLDTILYAAQSVSSGNNIRWNVIAPSGHDDAYSTNEDTHLVIPAPGVLANDGDTDFNPVLAGLSSGPAHGILEFRSDGSFVYYPNANYNGPDYFVYYATDNILQSSPYMVTLTVNPINDPPVVNAGANLFSTEGEKVTFSGTFSDVDLVGQADLAWDFGDGGTAVDTLIPEHTYLQNGIYTVTLTVTDDQAAAVSDTMQVFVSNVPPSQKLLDDRDSVVGIPLAIKYSMSDPSPLDPHTLYIYWGDGSMDTVLLAAGETELTFQKAYYTAGVHKVILLLEDGNGGQNMTSFNITAYRHIFLPVLEQ